MNVTEIQRLSVVETEVKNLSSEVKNIGVSVAQLHGKFDELSTHLGSNYVTKGEFEMWRKNRMLERILLIMATAVITGLIAFFFTEYKI